MAEEQTEVVYSESVRVESKVFYVDLKENKRGRYLKLSEKGSNRPRSTIIVPASGLVWFVKLVDYYLKESLVGQPVNKELAVENKVFYFSVGENTRGKFLRISESCLGHPTGRTSLVIPAAAGGDLGWATFRDSIQRVCSIGAQDSGAPQPEVSVSGSASVVGPGLSPPILSTTTAGTPVLSVWQKKFFFDLGENEKGAFLRITEVVRSDRSTLVIPALALNKFEEALSTCAAMLLQSSTGGAGPGPSAAE